MATLSERIVAPSEWVRAALAENAIPPEKIVVSGQSASAEFSDRKQRPLEGAGRREIVIGFLGRLERYKGADMLVRAGPRMAEGARLMADCLNRAAAEAPVSADNRPTEAVK